MLPTIEIGPLVIPSAGLVYILGIWLALTAAEKAAARLELNVAATYGVAVTTLATGFIAARLAFVALHWNAYQQNLLGIVWPLTSGYSLPAGLLFGIAGGFFYGRAKQLPAARTLDALAPSLIILLMTVSLGDFLAGPGYGLRADLPWSIDLFGVRRHPVQLYELLGGFLALAGWWLARRTPQPFPGRLFLVSTAIYGSTRLVTDTFRANAWLSTDGYHLLQIISLLAVLLSLLLLAYLSPPSVAES